MLVLDTSALVALLDADDEHHARCVALVDEVGEDLAIPSPVLVEVDYWARKRIGPEAFRVLAEDLAAGAYRLLNLDEDDLLRAADLESTYADLDLGFVDAAVIATCERFGEAKVATLDRRHFSVVRPRHCDALRLLPE